MADAINGGGGNWSVTTWPWPQVVFLEYYTLVFAIKTAEPTKLYLYELYCDTSNVWQATEIQDLGLVANVKYVTVADFNMFYVVTTYAKTGNVVTVDAWEKTVGSDAVSALPTSNSPVYACATNFNGQLVVGGIKHGDDTSFGNMAYNTVAWSEIGKFDFRMGEVAVTPGGPKRFNRSSGYRHMPWGEWGQGQVFQVKKLGGGVMVYGDGGVAMLEPKSQPVSTYAMHHISGQGISQGSAMDGDDKVHFWVDDRSQLWTSGTDFKPQKLGYKEFIEDLSGIVKLSYCPSRKRLFISNGSAGYILTEWGMYSTDQYATSMGVYRGTFCGFFADGDDKEIRITTDTLDFKARGLKTLERMGVGINYYNSDGDEMNARVDWRSDYQSNRDSFNAGEWKRLNNKGMVFPVVTASEFRVKLKGTTYVDSVANLDYIKMLIKFVDKHSVYGEGQKL